MMASPAPAATFVYVGNAESNEVIVLQLDRQSGDLTAVEKMPIPGVQYLVAVGSGKGGVGKTTVAVNLAIALATIGQRVGLLDADVYGPNVPLMFGVESKAYTNIQNNIEPIPKFGMGSMLFWMLV